MIRMPWKWIAVFLVLWAGCFVLVFGIGRVFIKTVPAVESTIWVWTWLISFFMAAAAVVKLRS
jgi:hypothetical protein